MALGMEVFNSANGPTDTDVSSGTINLSTMGTNRIVVLFVHTNATVRSTVSAVSDANGLTWALYEGHNFDSSEPTTDKQRLEIWWAYAAALQSSNTVTVTLSGSSKGIALGIGAISNVPSTRWTSPFDADPSLPAVLANPSLTDTDASETFSTHDDQTVGLAVWSCAISTVGNAPSAPSGWTQMLAVTTTGNGGRVQKLFVFGKVFSAQQVNTTVNLGSTHNWGMDVVCVGGNLIYPHSQVASAGF